MRAKHLFRDHRGATAIEYAIIAGLIGLGLVGSLVTTRGSLRAVFGTASSQMDSAGGAGAAFQGPGYQRQPYWSGKTLYSGYPDTQTSPGKTVKVYAYTDGSIVRYTYFNDSSKLNILEVRDTVAKTVSTMEISDTGGALRLNLTNYSDRIEGVISNVMSLQGYNSGDPPNMIVNSTSYNPSGDPTGSYTGSAKGADLAYANALYYDVKYFSGKTLVP